MAEGKRYYWLRLHHDFFDSKRIKKLRRMAGGDTYTIIYLKMQLLAMKTDGTLTWTGLEDDFAVLFVGLQPYAALAAFYQVLVGLVAFVKSRLFVA